jgi:hypothetical protein
VKFHISYDEHTSNIVTIDANGPDEALEAFWAAYNSVDSTEWEDLDNKWFESSGPQSIRVNQA